MVTYCEGVCGIDVVAYRVWNGEELGSDSILDGVYLSGGKNLRIMDNDNQFLGLESAWGA